MSGGANPGPGGEPLDGGKRAAFAARMLGTLAERYVREWLGATEEA